MTTLRDSADSHSPFGKSYRWSFRGIGAFRAATDGHGLRVGEYDLNILLLYTWQLAIEAERVWKLDEIILDIERLRAGSPAGKKGRTEGWIGNIRRYRGEWQGHVSRVG